MGLGPYKIVQVVPDQYIEFDKNPNYVNPVHLDKVFVKAVTAAVAVASVQSGEMDLSPVAAADITNLKTVSTVTPRFYHVRISTARKNLKKRSTVRVTRLSGSQAHGEK